MTAYNEARERYDAERFDDTIPGQRAWTRELAKYAETDHRLGHTLGIVAAADCEWCEVAA